MLLSEMNKMNNKIFALLEHGNEKQRIEAICMLKTTEKNYSVFKDIMLTDISARVRGNAMCGAFHSKPSKLIEITEIILEREDASIPMYRTLLTYFLEEFKSK